MFVEKIRNFIYSIFIFYIYIDIFIYIIMYIACCMLCALIKGEPRFWQQVEEKRESLVGSDFSLETDHTKQEGGQEGRPRR